jgi:hypothetical protein
VIGLPISCVINRAMASSSFRIVSRHLRRMSERSKAVFAFHVEKALTARSTACFASSTDRSGARSRTALVAGLMTLNVAMTPYSSDVQFETCVDGMAWYSAPPLAVRPAASSFIDMEAQWKELLVGTC